MQRFRALLVSLSTTSDMETSNTTESADQVVNIVHQRRRVNPESLALRLGPDLVRDLDALITPGNTEMPSFAVRKELQERYNIDRRHIYDYFHSRGLRVVKEDKQGVPLPTACLPHLRPLRQAPSRSHSSYPEVNSFKPRGVTKAKPGRPKKNASANLKVVPSTTCETSDHAEHSPPGTPRPTYVAVNPLLSHDPPPPIRDYTFNSVLNPLDESFSVSRAIGDIAYAYRHKMVFERMQELTEHPIKSLLTGDRLLPLDETSPCSASSKGLLLPHAKPLTRDERHAIYDSLSDCLGPARGIQECQGTYRKHMEARTKLYFEGLLSVPSHHCPQQSPRQLLDRKPPSGTNEFRHWLSETRFLKRDGMNNSPRVHLSHRNANMAKQCDADGVADKQFRQRSIPLWLQTLDDLFPTPGDDRNNVNPFADSPIDYSQEAARTAVYTRRFADACRAADQPLFLVASSPGSPVSSITETRQPDQAFHGLSGLSGSQQVKMRMPFGEADARSQWPECNPHVAQPGQYVILSDTLRKSRNTSNNARCPSSRSPRKRDTESIRIRPATSCDARRRTSSAAGDI